MSFINALFLFVIFILVYIVINEIFTVLFRLTGLTEDKAKFQVTSMLTNSGFTTSDSEIITASKVRRKLARITMIFGYAFTVTIVSSIINVLFTMNSAELKSVWPFTISFIVIFAFFQAIRKIPVLKEGFDHIIEKLGNKIIFGKFSNVVIVLDSYGENVVAEITLSSVPNILKGIALENTPLKSQYNINIMLLKREYDYMRIISEGTVLQKGDTIVVFGEYKNIRLIFEKTA